MKIVLIGSGNVATHLGIALKNAGHTFLQVFGRTEANVSALAKKLHASFTLSTDELNPKADLYLIALRDEVIAEVLPFIPNKKALVVHTSGSVAIDIFQDTFENPGVVYPLQTFSLSKKTDIKKVPFCLEVKYPRTKNKLSKVLKSMGAEIHWINSDKRKALHLAAVFANNFSNHMFVIAEELLKKNDLDFNLLRPLILETSNKIRNHSPSDMQTGPARRGDTGTIEKHLQLLVNKPEYAKMYRLITDSIEDHNGPVL
ncbi:MAG: DUF2520 domain-containing protein [Bacteroidetes bacterium]|nr:DUF2520 domain-containing protein [Bacteroidota bacterium]